MSDRPTPPRSLTVLPESGKREQLRAEFERAGGANRPLTDAPADIDTSPLHQKVVEVLKTVYDPELPVNIYDLGLIYAIETDDSGAVSVRMTLTAPGCPVAGTLPGEIQRKIASLEGVSSAKVDLVWEPPWSKDRMSEAAMLELGLL